MVIILVALTFLVAISAQVLIQYLARKRENSRVALEMGVMNLSPAMAVSNAGGVPRFPKDVSYHNGHAWMKLEEGNRIKVGLDDFTQRVMGKIDAIDLPQPGGKLVQGEVGWKVRHGERTLSQLAPLGGTVVEVNEKLRQDPTLVNRSPYEEGWILKIQTKVLSKEMPELMSSLKFKEHFDRSMAKLMSSFDNQSLGLAYADGGEIIEGVASKLDEKMWKKLVTELFHSLPEQP
jgi:glycine cleavage system H protein